MFRLYRELSISEQYESVDETNVVSEFYIPLLTETKYLKRTMGYFSVETLILAGKGAIELAYNGGKFALIMALNLKEANIQEDEEITLEEIEKLLLSSLKIPQDSFAMSRLEVIAKLLKNNQLSIKIAIPRRTNQKGIYYKKMGIMEDFQGDLICFDTQINEEPGEYISNYESIDVYCSWNEADKKRVKNKLNNFNNLWNNQDPFYKLVDFPSKVKNIILSFDKDIEQLTEPEISKNINVDSNPNHVPVIPEFIEVREYQQEAIRNWFRNNCQGLLEMATGTGKTITALSATSKLWEVTNRLGVVIVCPYMHLVDQWVKDIKLFNMTPIVAYQSRSLWEDYLFNEVSAFKARISDHFCLITTVATFTSEAMQKILRTLDDDVLFIADEAHHLGAKKNRKALIELFPYRLALSATPNRWYDDEGTDELICYFGNAVVFQYDLKQAIGTFLTEYYYYPHFVYLDEDESEYYFEITRKISKLAVINDSEDNQEALESLLIERARIISRARNKLKVLKDLMSKQQDAKYNIVYCGDSRTDGEKQIDAVVKILGNDLRMKVHTFTSRENKEERRELLKRFEDGELQALVAIKCLDEGVDVPATQTAYILSSSTNPREFIQRRGRVLRKHKNKTYSYIHDFIVLPRSLDEISLIEPSIFNIERKMIKRELQRFTEFADLALNGPVANQKLDQVKKAYNLMDF